MSSSDDLLLFAGVAAIIGAAIFAVDTNRKANKKLINQQPIQEPQPQPAPIPPGPYHDFLLKIKKLYQERNFTQAVQETSKLFYKVIQDKSGIRDIDGTTLVDRAFGKNGVLRFIVHKDHQHIDTHEGFYFLCRGASLAFRNPAAHALIELSEQEAGVQIAMMAYLIDHIDRQTIKIDQTPLLAAAQ